MLGSDCFFHLSKVGRNFPFNYIKNFHRCLFEGNFHYASKSSSKKCLYEWL